MIALDSNEYINFLNRKSDAEKLSKIIAGETVHINELITKEVLRNVREEVKRDFYSLLLKNNFVIDNEKVPEHLCKKYRQLGLRKGDVAIAAFCEKIEADCLISENRHFLKEAKFDKFKVSTLKEFFDKRFFGIDR